MDNINLIYDIASIPHGINIDGLYNIIESSGMVVWDSRLGKEPKIVDKNSNLTLVDLKFLSEKDFEENFRNIKE